jgi:hypothetical protein
MSAFYAIAGSTAAALADATNFTEVFDIAGNFNPTTGIFTAPVADVYEFGASGQLPLTAGRGMVVSITDGTNSAAGGAHTDSVNASPVNIRAPVTFLANLAAGATVKVQLSLTGYAAGTCDYFWGKRIL